MGGDGGKREWWMGEDDGCRGSAKGGIPAGAMIPKTRHSRESGDLGTFATGRMALDGRPWVSWCPLGVWELE